jgi:hypothetical protein
MSYEVSVIIFGRSGHAFVKMRLTPTLRLLKEVSAWLFSHYLSVYVDHYLPLTCQIL